MMSGIQGKDTKPELIVRSFLHRKGLRFRTHVKSLPGKPDLALRKYRAVVEARGCFWHRHAGCKYAYIPKTRIDFWEKKFRDTVLRDKSNEEKLKALGWRVLVVWECEVAVQGLELLYEEIVSGG